MLGGENMLDYVKIVDDNSIEKFITLAENIWHEYFPFLLSNEQINYMLHKFQSFDAIKKQQNEGYEYYFIYNDKELVGYIVFVIKEEHLFLSKLYFLKNQRGKGFGRKALEYLCSIAEANNLRKIILTVNKYNENSIAAYKKWGFKTIESKIFDIGHGYVMDDYIMQFEF